MDSDFPENLVAALYHVADLEEDVLLEWSERIRAIRTGELLRIDVCDSLKDREQILPYICALLNGLTQIDADTNVKRYTCFARAVKVIKEGVVIDQQRVECIDLLSQHLRLLDSSHSQKIANAILDNFILSSEASVRGHSSLLEELFAVLVGRGDAGFRDHMVKRICDMDWHMKSISMLASALVEISEKDTQCSMTLHKIATYIRWDYDDILGSTGARTQDGDGAIAVEELPTLFYQLSSLGRKCEGNSAYLRTVVDTLVHSLDNLLFELYADSVDSTVSGTQFYITAPTQADPTGSRGLSNWDGIARGYKSSSHIKRRLDSVLATIVHHLSLLVTKDQGMAAEVGSSIKQRRMMTSIAVMPPPGSTMTGTQNAMKTKKVFSPGRLLLCALSARVPRQEDKIIHGLRDAVLEMDSVKERIDSTLWYQARVWRHAGKMKLSDLQQALILILRGPLLVDVLVVPLISFGFSLVDAAKGDTKKSTESLSGSVIPITAVGIGCHVHPNPQGPQQQEGGHGGVGAGVNVGAGAESFGVWLLIRLFCLCEHARAQIMKEITMRLLICGSASHETQTSSAFASAASSKASMSAVARCCVAFISRVAVACPHGLLETADDLQETFTSISDLEYSTAAQLVEAMGPLFISRNALADRCALSLRKASFCKDIVRRKTAISALVALLKVHLSLRTSTMVPGHEMGGSIGLSQSAMGSQRRYQERQIGLSMDEVMQLLRRFLQHQHQVRSLLYAKLLNLQLAFPAFRPTISKLLMSHLLSFLKSKEDALVCGTKDQTPAQLKIQPTAPDNSSGNEADYYYLDLAVCLDGSSSTARHLQENLSNLILSLLSLVSSPNQAYRAMTPNDFGIPGSSQSQSLDTSMSQQDAALSQGDALFFGETATNGVGPKRMTPDERDACRLLYDITERLATTGVTEYRIDTSATKSVNDNMIEYLRCAALLHASHAALVSVFTLPDKPTGSGSAHFKVTFDESRLNLVEPLVDNMMNLQQNILPDKMNVHKQFEDERLGVGKKKRKKSETNAEADTLNEDEETASQSIAANLKALKKGSGRISLEMDPCKEKNGPSFLSNMKCEFEFIHNALTQLYPKAANKDDDDDDGTVPFTVPFLSGSDPKAQAAFLRDYTLKTAVSVFEKLLQEMMMNSDVDTQVESWDDMASLARSDGETSFMSSRTDTMSLSSRQIQARNRDLQIAEMIILSTKIFPLLSRVLMKSGQPEPKDSAEKRDNDAEKPLRVSQPMLLRAMYGAIRILTHSGRFRPSMDSLCRTVDGTATMQTAMPTAATAHTNVQPSVETSALKRMLLSFVTECGVETAQNRNLSLKAYCFTFMQIMFCSQAANAQEAIAIIHCEEKCFPIFIAIIAEITTLMLPVERSKFSKSFMDECQKELFRFSPKLTQSLIHLMTLRLPNNSAERIGNTVKVCELIAQCAEYVSDDADDANEKDIDRPYTLFSENTFNVSVSLVVALLDKALEETMALMKIREKHKVSNKRPMSIEGRIFSDDEDDDDDGGNHSSSHCGAGRLNGAQLEHIMLRRLAEAAHHLLSASIHWDVETDKIIGLFVKLYKLLVKHTRILVTHSIKRLPDIYSKLMGYMAETCHGELSNLLSSLHKNGKNGDAAKIVRQSKQVPELVYQMEQLDAQLIKLSSTVTDKGAVRKLITRSTARDFRLTKPRRAENDAEGRAGEGEGEGGNENDRPDTENVPSARYGDVNIEPPSEKKKKKKIRSEY